MAYSYLPVGCACDAYDVMAANLDHKVFFAGEVQVLANVNASFVRLFVVHYG